MPRPEEKEGSEPSKAAGDAMLPSLLGVAIPTAPSAFLPNLGFCSEVLRPAPMLTADTIMTG